MRRLDLCSDNRSILQIKDGRPARQFALGEGRSKGRSGERVSDRAADLRDDIGSCHVPTGIYERMGALGLPNCGTIVVDADSSPVIRRNDEWTAQRPASSAMPSYRGLFSLDRAQKTL